jgi:HEAT repeat protein
MNRLWLSVALVFPMLVGCDREEAAAPPKAHVAWQNQPGATYFTASSVPLNVAPKEPRYQGKSIAEWIDHQQADLDENFRAEATNALGEFAQAGHADKVVPTLLTALGDKSDSVRTAAAGQLAGLSETEHSGTISTAFLDTLDDETSFEVRHHVLTFLLRRNVDTAARAIVAMAAYERSAYREENAEPQHCGSYGTFDRFAASVFDKSGPKSIPHIARAMVDIHEAALPMNNLALARLLSPHIRRTQELNGIAFDDPRLNLDGKPILPRIVLAVRSALPRLIESLGHEQARVRVGAAISLTLLGKAAEPASEKLIELAADGKQPYGVRLHSITALGHLSNKIATKPLGVVASDRELSQVLRKAAVESLGRIGGDAAFKALAQVIQDGIAAREWNDPTYVDADRVLAGMNAAHEQYVPVLIEMAISEDIDRDRLPGAENFSVIRISRLDDEGAAMAHKLLNREMKSDRAERAKAASRVVVELERLDKASRRTAALPIVEP